MIIWKGYYYFKKGKGRILQTDLEQGHRGSLYRRGSSFDIIIRENDPLEEKVITVLHELAHIGVEYEIMQNPFLNKPGITDNLLDSKVNQEVDKATQEFYNRNPTLVQKIRELLEYRNKFKLSSQLLFSF